MSILKHLHFFEAQQRGVPVLCVVYSECLEIQAESTDFKHLII